MQVGNSRARQSGPGVVVRPVFVGVRSFSRQNALLATTSSPLAVTLLATTAVTGYRQCHRPRVIISHRAQLFGVTVTDKHVTCDCLSVCFSIGRLFAFAKTTKRNPHNPIPYLKSCQERRVGVGVSPSRAKAVASYNLHAGCPVHVPPPDFLAKVTHWVAAGGRRAGVPQTDGGARPEIARPGFRSHGRGRSSTG